MMFMSLQIVFLAVCFYEYQRTTCEVLFMAFFILSALTPLFFNGGISAVCLEGKIPAVCSGVAFSVRFCWIRGVGTTKVKPVRLTVKIALERIPCVITAILNWTACLPLKFDS